MDLSIAGPLCEPGNVAFSLEHFASLFFDAVSCYAFRGLAFGSADGTGEVHIRDRDFQIQNPYPGSPTGITSDTTVHIRNSSFVTVGGDSDLDLSAGVNISGEAFFTGMAATEVRHRRGRYIFCQEF